MAEPHTMVRYFYRKGSWSGRAVSHAFDYLSRLSDISFIEDRDCPDIWACDGEAAPKSARLLIAGENAGKDAAYVRRGDVWAAILDSDPISEVLSKISASYFLGPYSNQKPSPSPSGVPTLSAVVTGFLKALEDAEIVPRGNGRIALWPAPYKFGLALTHDIDIARRTIAGSARLLFHKHPAGGARGLFDALASSLVGKPNPYDCVGRWLEAEKELGIQSTFFVFAGERAHEKDPRYDLGKLSGALAAMRRASCELGLHSGIACFRGDRLAEAKRQLEASSGIKAMGLRPHFLSAKFPEYWAAARASGFSYSSSLGFDDDIGFMGGIDLPFFPFDIEADKGLGIIEIPIAVMDCGLIGDSIASAPETFERGARLLERAAATGGLIVLDWHQRTFYNPDYPGWARLCLDLVRHAKKLGAQPVSLGQLACGFENHGGGDT